MIESAPRIREPLLTFEHCGLAFAQTRVLRDVSFSVRAGEFVSILGPSGCGKSTLLRLMLGLLQPGSGSLLRHAPGETMGIVFQKPVLMPWHTARENVVLSLELGPKRLRDKKERTRRAAAALELVGLVEFGEHYPHQLSGGMQQRVAIARALAAEPSMLLMDEPFGALDELTRETMNLHVLRLWESPQTKLETLVMVTHSITEAVMLSDRIIVMSPRPATVDAIVDIDLPSPRSHYFSRLPSDRLFNALVEELRERIRLSSV